MDMAKKYIVVVGGVISGVGKGVVSASLAKIMEQYGYSTTIMKCDPYLNMDAGTLRPTQHGEVWVTADGGEIDQDFGTYERFLGRDIPRRNGITSGQVFGSVLERERRGDYEGDTVQPIPHVTNEIRARIEEAGAGHDIVIVEIGGTVGDYENQLFFFAMKNLERDIGSEHVAYVLVPYLVVPAHIGEMKTKPVQQATMLLSREGIFPDFIVCRGVQALDAERRKKIMINANIREEYIISAPDVDTIYRVPADLEQEGMGQKMLQRLSLEPRLTPHWRDWNTAIERVVHPTRSVTIAIVGKYIDVGDFVLHDSYTSIIHALQAAGASLDTNIDIRWVDAKKLETQSDPAPFFEGCSGILVPGGFGVTGVEGKIRAIQYAREHQIPFFGICLGMQLAVVEFARSVCGMTGAHSVEMRPDTAYPVVAMMESQRDVLSRGALGGTMRLGEYGAVLQKGTLIYQLYEQYGRIEGDGVRREYYMQSPDEAFRMGVCEVGETVVFERHRHRYEISPDYVSRLSEKGLVFSGFHRTTGGVLLMEYIELPSHPFFVATQAHPEFRSYFAQASPLFGGFISAALDYTL